MKNTLKNLLIASLAYCPLCTMAQKDIVVSDSLNANADKMNVKMGTQGMGKIWKFRFGDYAVTTSKMGWTTTSSKSNLFNNRTESKTTQKFSFTMSGSTADVAHVNAADNIQVKELNQIEVLPHFSLGNNELLKESNNFTVYITINDDSTDTWALLMNVLRGTEVKGNYSYEEFMTNGTRKIFFVRTSSNKNGDDKRNIPAVGYELIENGQALGAVQFYGGGMMGANKNIIWIHRDLDPKMKLLLAATMTAVLQKKVNQMSY